MEGIYMRCSKISSRGIKVDSTARLPKSQNIAKAVSRTFLYSKKIRPVRLKMPNIDSRVTGGARNPVESW